MAELRIVQVGDVAQVAPAIAAALGTHVDIVNLPLRQAAATLAGPIKGLAAPLRFADAIGLARQVRSLDPDVVHVHWVPNGIVGPLTGRPWLLHAHGSDIRRLNVWRRIAFGPLLRMADAVVVSTPDLLEFAPHGAAHLPTPIAVPDIELEPRWDVLVASVASSTKGSAIAFEALRRLALMRPQWRLAAADGPEFEVGPWDKLGWTTKEDFHNRLAAARLVLGQFRVGALGIADLEAMALGRPLVTWVREDLYGDRPPLISSRDPATIAARATELLDGGSADGGLGAAGADWVRRTHGPERVAADLLALYRRLAG